MYYQLIGKSIPLTKSWEKLNIHLQGNSEARFVEILNPESQGKLTKTQRLKTDAKAVSNKRALELIRKNSAKHPKM